MAVNEAMLVRAMIFMLARPAIEKLTMEIIDLLITQLGEDKVIQLVRESDTLEAEVRAALGVAGDK